MSTETTKRARDAPPHAASAPSELGFDFAPPEMEEPIMSKKQRKLANYNPRGRPAAGTVYTPPVRAVEVVERMQEGRGEEGGAEEKVEGGEEGMQEATGEGEKMEEDPDVPALSHKALRLAKRRKLAGLPDVPIIPTSTAGNSIPGVPGVIIGNTPGKSAHGIWLGNMNYGTTNKMLLAWLEERGLKEIVRINMPSGRREGEMNRGFAYLDFPTPADVELAVSLSEQHLDGRKLLIKASSDFTGRPTTAPLPLLDPSALIDPIASTSTSNAFTDGSPAQTLNKTARKILDRQKNSAGPTLFIGNLGFETTVEDIRTMFDAHQRAAGAWLAKSKGRPVDENGDLVEEDLGEDDEDEDRDDDDDDDAEGEGEKEVEAEVVDENVDLSTLVPPPRKERIKRDKLAPKEPKDLSKAKDAGIRKIRLGTFEDTGKCKGWAFVDFHLPAQCTRALLNVRNHSLDGRTLNVEYASADAVRRGGIGTRAAVPQPGGGGGRGAPRGGARGGRGGDRGSARGGRGGAGTARGKGREWDDEDASANVEEDTSRDYDMDEPVEKAPRGEFGFRPNSGVARGRGAPRGRGDRGGRGGSGGERVKSGAALAGAQRASESIVESTGRKTTFD